jgi:hypothetical protein
VCVGGGGGGVVVRKLLNVSEAVKLQENIESDVRVCVMVCL